MRSFIPLLVVALLALTVAVPSCALAYSATETRVETKRFIRALERQFRVEGRGYFKAETDLSRWLMTARDAARAAREARWEAGYPAAPLGQVNSMIKKHCQILSPACVSAVLVLSSEKPL